MPTFPNPCSRCGFCCIAQTCDIGMQAFNVSKNSSCPGLSFDENGQASCNPFIKCLDIFTDMDFYDKAEEILQFTFGIGKGCCISARAIHYGETFPFASLPAEIKKGIVSSMRRL